MDAQLLIGPPSNTPYPAPYWFLVMFKVLGFTLHALPMNLYFAGTVLALYLGWRGSPPAQRWSGRFLKQLPIIIATGINLGIVPLLFLQVAYNQVFYPATILMAWPWFAIIPLLTLAYYGAYIYAVGLKKHGPGMTALRRKAGWISAILFIILGFLYTNAFSLMTRVEAWPGIWESTSVAGAPLGIGLNTADPTVWPRWLMFFGLALVTTSAYVVFDAAWFGFYESPQYRRWAAGFAFRLSLVGMAWVMLTGSWYLFIAMPASVRQPLLSMPLIILTAATALSPGLTWLLIFLQKRRGGAEKKLALFTVLAQFVVLGLNAVSRQFVQNMELSPYVDVTQRAVQTQWGILSLFLLSFVIGLAILIWMFRYAIEASRRTAASEHGVDLVGPAASET